MAEKLLLLLFCLPGCIPAATGEICSVGNEIDPGSNGHGPASLTTYTRDPCTRCSEVHLGGVNVMKAGQKVLGATYMQEMVIGNDAREIQTLSGCPEPCDIKPLGVGKPGMWDPSYARGLEPTSTRLNDQIRLCPEDDYEVISVDLGRPERVAGVWLQPEQADVTLRSLSATGYMEFYYGNQTGSSNEKFVSFNVAALQVNNPLEFLLDDVIVARYWRWKSINAFFYGCFLFDLLGCNALCRDPLGLSDGFIPDANIHVSGHLTFDDFGPERARPIPSGVADLHRTWCAGEQGGSIDWIQVDLTATTVSGVKIDFKMAWMTADDMYVGFTDRDGIWSVIHSFSYEDDSWYFAQPVVPMKLRIYIPRTPDKETCLRFELLGCRDCLEMLGMTDGSIPDSAISASTASGGDFEAWAGRLNSLGTPDIGLGGAWCSIVDDIYSWISVDLGRPLPVSGVITQGAACCQYWVESFKVKYTDADTAEEALVSTGQVFVGNNDSNTAVENIFDQPVVARHVRIVVLKWHQQACLRFELLGCKGCNDTLGMEDGTIGDEDITASSSKILRHNPIDELRLGQPKPNGWSYYETRYVTNQQWFQFDLGRATVITGITLYSELYDGTHRHQLEYGLDPSQWALNLDRRNQTVYFETTGDKTAVRLFTSALYARYVRVSSEDFLMYGHNPQIELWGCRARCEDRLGVEDGTIPDDRLTASSVPWNGAHSARLNNNYAWTPPITDSHPWIQVNLGVDTVVSGVITQGGARLYKNGTAEHMWVKTFTAGYTNGWLESTMSGSIHDINDERGVQQVFSANLDEETPVKNLFRQPVSASLVRILPLSWHRAISMRLELLGCPSVCQERLGMESGEIKDHQLSCSGSWNSQTHGPQRARLNQRADPEVGLAGGWRADSDESGNTDMWIQIDFAQWTNLTGVITQGREDKAEWVTRFKVAYLWNDWYWQFVSTTQNGQPQEFVGNYDNYNLVTNFFLHQVVTRSVRVYPVDWHNNPSMRLEPLGCPVRCQSQLGMEDGTIPDTAINVSLISGAQPDDVRLLSVGAYETWSPLFLSTNTWIQVDLGERAHVSGIILQKWYSEWYHFRLAFATLDDLTEWTAILSGDKNEMFTSYHYLTWRERHTSFFYYGVFARHIRLEYLPINDEVMRFDFIGCRNHPRTTTTCQTLLSDGYLLDGTYDVDVDGLDQGLPPFQVTCSMKEGATIVHPKAEGTVRMSGSFDQPDVRDIPYGIDMEQIISVINSSSACEQTLEVKCGPTDPAAFVQQTVLHPVMWRSPSGELMQVGDCNINGEFCNCGIGLNRSSWMYDKVVLTDKDTLPVTLIEVYAPDGLYVTVGALTCKWPHNTQG